MENPVKNLTPANVAYAFSLETQAIQKYNWFAKIAVKEGYQQIAAIFAETAEQKMSHCKNLYRFIENAQVQVSVTMFAEPLASTLENLKAAAKAETEQAENLFGDFEKTAFGENFKKIGTKLKLFRKIKKFYASRFEKLAANIENETIFRRDKKVKWICRKCGLIYESERALKNCPGCEHPQAYFEILAENY